MERRKAYSQMELFNALRRTVLKLLNLQMVKKIYCSLMVLGSESTQMVGLGRLIQMEPVKILLDNNDDE
jgi:hypothetical protein